MTISKALHGLLVFACFQASVQANSDGYTAPSLALRTSFLKHLGRETPVEKSLKDWVDSRTILFINGLGSSAADLAEYSFLLRQDFAVNLTDFLSFAPSDFKGVAENAEILYSQILWLQKHGLKKQLVLIGQSKGGAELFLTMLKHPHLIRDGIVGKVVVMQAPVGGTPLAGLLTRLKKSSLFFPEQSFNVLGNFGHWVLNLGWLEGAESLSPEMVSPLIRNALADLDEKTRQDIGRNLFFMTAQEDPSLPKYPPSSVMLFNFARDIFPKLKSIDSALPFDSFDTYKDSFGAWDDFVPLQFQSLSQVGITFSPLFGSHGNFLNSTDRFKSTSSHAEIKAYLRALFETISAPK